MSAQSQHPFDAALALEPSGEGRFLGRTSTDYANMVGPFGGLTNALLLQAVLLHPARIGVPIALTVNFAGPVADGAFEIEALPARTNRSTQHWTLQLRQGDATATTGTAVFAERRETWSAQEARMPNVVPPTAVPRASTRGLPAWVARYDMRFLQGGLEALNGEEQPDSLTRLWIRDDPPRPLTFTSLAALCDNFFPRVMVRRRKLLPAGTVSITTYFHADAALLAAQSDRYLFGVARALVFRNGYLDQTAELWSDDGTLLASSHQVVYYRE